MSSALSTQTGGLLLSLAGARRLADGPLIRLVGGIGPATWAAVLARAMAERLVAQVEAHLHDRGLLLRVAAPVQEALRAAHRRSFAEFHRQVVALVRLAAAFQAAGVEFRLLKGLAIAASVYPTPTARTARDLDIWVRPADAGRAVALLRDLGMIEHPDRPQPLPFLRAFDKELAFIPQGVGDLPAQVDLHWHLTSPWWLRTTLRVPEGDLFARPHPVAIGGQVYQTLAPTETLYYLCLNAGFGDRFARLRAFVDFALLLERGAIDWPRLRALAAASGTEVVLWRCFDLLDKVLSTRHARRLAPAPARAHRRLVRALLPGPLHGPPRAEVQNTAGVSLQEFVLLPHPAAMARALGRLVWPPAEWIRLRYAPLPGGSLARARLGHLARLRGLGEVLFHQPGQGG